MRFGLDERGEDVEVSFEAVNEGSIVPQSAPPNELVGRSISQHKNQSLNRLQ